MVFRVQPPPSFSSNLHTSLLCGVLLDSSEHRSLDPRAMFMALWQLRKLSVGNCSWSREYLAFFLHQQSLSFYTYWLCICLHLAKMLSHHGAPRSIFTVGIRHTIGKISMGKTNVFGNGTLFLVTTQLQISLDLCPGSTSYHLSVLTVSLSINCDN